MCSLIAVRPQLEQRPQGRRTNSAPSSWRGGPRASGARWTSASSFGDDRFVDVSFADLQTDSVRTVADSYDQLGLELHRRGAREGPGVGRRAQARLTAATHTYELADYGLTPEQVRERVQPTTSRPTTRRPEARRDVSMTSSARARRRKKLEPDPRVRSAIAGGRSENRSRGRGPRPQRRPGARPRAAEHPGVLSALRLEGPAGVGRVPRDGTGRDAAAEAEDGRGAPTRSTAVVAWIDGRLDLAFNARDPLGSAPDVAGGADADVRRARVGRRPPTARSCNRSSNSSNAEASSGSFPTSTPTADALSIQGAIWASVERQWATGRMLIRSVATLRGLTDAMPLLRCADSGRHHRSRLHGR